MNVNDKYAVGLGIIRGASFNADSTKGSPNVIVNMYSQSVQGDNVFGIPSVLPYGIISIPPDNTYGVTVNVTGLTTTPICLGTIPSNVNLYSTSGLNQGESSLYSQKYSLQAKLSGLLAKLDNGKGTNTATMLYGENVVKVLIDIIEQMIALYDTQFANIITQINKHTHIVDKIQSGPGSITAASLEDSGPSIDIPKINSNLPQDLSDLNAGKAYVNDLGEPM